MTPASPMPSRTRVPGSGALLACKPPLNPSLPKSVGPVNEWPVVVLSTSQLSEMKFEPAIVTEPESANALPQLMEAVVPSEMASMSMANDWKAPIDLNNSEIFFNNTNRMLGTRRDIIRFIRVPDTLSWGALVNYSRLHDQIRSCYGRPGVSAMLVCGNQRPAGRQEHLLPS